MFIKTIEIKQKNSKNQYKKSEKKLIRYELDVILLKLFIYTQNYLNKAS